MNWQTIRRETSLIEHICEDGVGHPNSYSVARLNKLDNEDAEEWGELIVPLEKSHRWIHGCDGCCHRRDFPGRKMTDAELWLRLSDRYCDYLQEVINIREMQKWLVYTAHDLKINHDVGWR